MSCCNNCNQPCACESAAPEGGNVYIPAPEPLELDVWESLVIYTGIAIASVASIAVIAGATGWIYQTFIGG